MARWKLSRVALFLFLVISPVISFAAPQGIENQVAQVLTKVFNLRNFSVSVRESQYTEVVDIGKDKRNLLPGVPVEEKLQRVSDKKLMQRNRLLITLILEKGISPDLEKRIERVIRVSLSLGNEDSLKIIKEDFVAQKRTLSSAPGEPSVLSAPAAFVLYISKPQNIVLLIVILIISVFLFGPLRYFMKYMAQYFSAASGAAGAGSGAGRENESSPIRQMPVNLLNAASESKKSEGQETDRPFAFINDKNIANLAFLMKDESSEKIAEVLGFLKETLVEKFLQFYPEEKQSDIMSFLVYKKELNKEDIIDTENTVKEKINYVSGGREQLLSMLENSSRQVQEQFLRHIADEDPIMASEIRNSVFHFEDLARQDTQVVQTVLRFVNTRNLAQALQFAEQEVKDRIFTVLSEGAREIVSEELELLPSNSAASDREKKNIVAVIRRLKDAGTIELR
ncbi:MAG: FliG C-terminal domain-containing protein [Elusimicrobiota bacterium]|nr:FliG C-terminal domain-containing protein [Elusimicrobiota bacterium]